MSAEFSKRAVADLESILSYYERAASSRVAATFEGRLQTIVARISQRPESAQAIPERPGVRVVPMITFPYKIFLSHSCCGSSEGLAYQALGAPSDDRMRKIEVLLSKGCGTNLTLV
jgi:plasmid stabilization system protein ParE